MSLFLRSLAYVTYAFLSVLFTSLVSGTTTRTRNFDRIVSPSGGIVSSGVYTAPSVSACCVRCLSRHTSSYVTYNKSTRSCKCVSGLSRLLPPPPSSDLLYGHTLGSQCEVFPGFDVFRFNDLNVCLMMGADKKTYVQAVAECALFSNGRLFIGNTTDKQQVLATVAEKHNVTTTCIWVGLDDRMKEGEFVWSDGHIATEEEKLQLFKEGQPDNANNADCVCFYPQYVAYSDGWCGYRLRYICEIPLIY
ncbi:lectin-like [Aplysia californica]|uniref:Lectin-like n=1 Tax=Aplysia californica TaxID=6500 RepID=A0ABM1VX71_APLCA|nr:lectin-like [Aplysia californica]